MAEGSEKLIEDYKKLQETLSEKRKAATESGTYQSSGRVGVSKTDLERAKEIYKLEEQGRGAVSEYQKLRWYGDEEKNKKRQELFEQMTPEERRREGVLMKGLHTISTPLYATVGAAETLLGKGSKAGMFANIQANVKERETFGDLVRKYGLSNWVATPLGLMLDIALDPVNWATVGTGALVPRVALGAYRGARTGHGALKAVGKGLESSLASKAARLTKAIPGSRKLLGKEIDALERRASRASDWYDKYTDNTDIGKKLALTKLTDKIKSKVSKLAEIFPESWRRQAKEFTEYDPQGPLAKAQAADDARRAAGEAAPEVVRTRERARELIMGADNKGPLDDLLDEKLLDPLSEMRGEASKTARLLDDADGLFDSPSAAENLNRLKDHALSEEQKQHMIGIIQDMAQDKSGVRIIDESKQKFGEWMSANHAGIKKKLETTLDGYKEFIGNFKLAKVPLSFTAWTNALLGNSVMVKMLGLDLSKELADSVWNSFRLANGGRPSREFLSRLTGNEKITTWMEDYPGAFTMAFGMDQEALRHWSKLYARAQKLPKGEADEVIGALKQAQAEAKVLSDRLRPAGSSAAMASRVGSSVPSDAFISTYSSDVFAGMMDSHQRIMNKLSNSKSARVRKFAEGYDKYWKKPMQWYESVDQGFKLGLFTHLTNNGVSRRELESLGKFVNLNEIGSFTRKAGYDKYVLNPQKAAQAAQEAFMNYRAMPGVVRTLRNLPVMGMPFVSFAYAMLNKTGRTAINNPAFFSKMNSFFSEVSGGQDPVERAHLESVYNNYLNQPGMLKLPFPLFANRPAYLRFEQMIPYYSMNIFQPGARDFDSKTADMVTGAMDKVGIFSDPAGQVLFNYLVLPMMLEDELPKGMFGQQLYPSDATAAQKTAYATRDLAEAVTPQFISPFGTVAALAGDKPARMPGDPLTEAIPIPGIGTEEYFPLFRWRQFARSMRGQSSLGIAGGKNSEPAGQRWVRTALQFVGIPVYAPDIYMSGLEPDKEE